MLYTYTAWYLGIGIAVFLGYYLYNEPPSNDGRRGSSEMQNLIRYAKRNPLRVILIDAVVFVIGTVLALGLWPVFAAVEAKDLIQESRRRRGKPKFAANKGNLKKLMGIDEIGAAEMVSDPLNAVPNLPFGHLNGAWEAFKGKRIDGDEIWFFATATVAGDKPVEGMANRMAEGYALLREGKVINEFCSHGR